MSLLTKTIRHLFMPNWGRSFIVLKRFNLAYGAVLKAANSSIKLSLHDMMAGEQLAVPNVNRGSFWEGLPDDAAAWLTAAEVVRLHPDAFIFSFTRNPFSRIASCYYDKLVFKTAAPDFYRRRGFAVDLGLPSSSSAS